MMDPSEVKKRKYTVDKNLFLFTNDRFSKKSAALYEFKISVTKWSDGKYVVDSFYNEGDTLEAIETFYDQRIMPKISSVAACILGSNLLYLIPHDEDRVLPADLSAYFLGDRDDLKKALVGERETLAPCLFDLSQKKKKSNLCIESPLARKTKPTLITIGNKVFALSSPCDGIRCPEPCFESLVVVTHDDDHDYDDTFKQWTPLDCPPFHLQNTPVNVPLDFLVLGIVVLEEEGLILVSTQDQQNTASCFSYNIHSEKWSPVRMDRVDDTPDVHGFPLPPYIFGNAAVVNNNIYTYFSDYRKLLVYPYTYTGGCDLSIGSVSEVEGFKYQDNYDDFGPYFDAFRRSGSVTKVDDEILCVIHTICPSHFVVQNLCITFIQVVGDGKECTTLKSFTCTLSNGTEFYEQAIKSCFVLNDLEEKSDHRSAKQSVMPSDADDKALMEMNRCGTRERDAQEVDAM